MNEKSGYAVCNGTVNWLTRQPDRFRLEGAATEGVTVAQQRVSGWLRIDLLIIVVVLSSIAIGVLIAP
jgi:hypothetical protein